MTEDFHAQDRVKYSALLLDDVWSGWFTEINLRRMRMSSIVDCVGSQLIQSMLQRPEVGYVNFRKEFLRRVGVSPEHWELRTLFMGACGFTADERASNAEVDLEYAALGEAWRVEILLRRALKAQKTGESIPLSSRDRLHEITLSLINERLNLSRSGNDPLITSNVVAHLRDTAAELMTLIGAMQADLDKR